MVTCLSFRNFDRSARTLVLSGFVKSVSISAPSSPCLVSHYESSDSVRFNIIFFRESFGREFGMDMRLLLRDCVERHETNVAWRFGFVVLSGLESSRTHPAESAISTKQYTCIEHSMKLFVCIF
jgi:hypothetical protein